MPKRGKTEMDPELLRTLHEVRRRIDDVDRRLVSALEKLDEVQKRLRRIYTRR